MQKQQQINIMKLEFLKWLYCHINAIFILKKLLLFKEWQETKTVFITAHFTKETENHQKKEQKKQQQN